MSPTDSVLLLELDAGSLQALMMPIRATAHPAATVTEIPGRSSDKQRLAKAAEAGPRARTIVEFIQQLRAYVVQEFARGKEIDQIFGDLEGSYRRLEKALRKS